LKEEVSLGQQIKEAYVMYHSPWIEPSKKDYWWKKIQELSKKRSSEA
tara:strand:- start:312 stop:452 length:141 start_codon:yes stop_codon:yes gene_type:complete